MPATSAAVLAQILPLVALILFPALALKLLAFARPRVHNFTMALGALFPWNWGSPHGHESVKEREHAKKRRVRTRAEQLQEKNGLNKNEKTEIPLDLDADVIFPGLVNMSGTHCFMNSTLQALASLSALPAYLLAIRSRAERLDVPTPVVDALLDLLAALNTPGTQPLRATALGSTGAKGAALLASHEHQDAQELFQLLSECVREERARVAREGGRDRGFALPAMSPLASPSPSPAEAGAAGDGPGAEDWEALASPFDGLTATRRACVRCGYTAAIRHFAFDSVQLAHKLTHPQTTLPALLRAYTSLEVLHDCACRRCQLRATARRLAEEAARLAGDGAEPHEEKRADDKESGGPTPSRVRRLKAVRRMEARVLRALEAGRIEEEELEAIERVVGGVCTRQSMLGRPPAILALHINRSVHTGLRVAKNGARVAFPELLDLAPYTTGGVLSLEPTSALSAGDACIYRLAAAVCHYGQHAFGHYICFRRAPVPMPSSPYSPAPSKTAGRAAYGPARPTSEGSEGTGVGWLRISDARVDRCGVEQVLAEGSAVFMLYYERVPPPPVYAGAGVGVLGEADSAETLRPGHIESASPSASMSASVSTSMSMSLGGSGLWGLGADGGAKARVVRSVSVGLGSVASATLSSSSLSPRSVSVASTPAPSTPRARPAEEDGHVEDLALSGSRDADDGAAEAQEDGAALPTPPPTPSPRGDSEEPAASPPSKTQKKKKKKKGKQEGAQAQAAASP
ncbi:hypothetical protein FB451DRAFT_1099175 [Mycena latifolia]|nr:hypothetical protein FB451DRAFT_1099175 [Mycena latifolia]